MFRPQRGDLYRLKPRGAEGKARPVVIVSRDELNGGHSVLALPFYSQQLEKRASQQWCVRYAKGEVDWISIASPKPMKFRSWINLT